MASERGWLSALKFRPLTAQRWPDLEHLFGERGACGGCWCMWWRLKRSQFEKQKGAANKNALKKIVKSGEIPGLLAYVGNDPIGWCAVAPRENYPVLERSQTLKRVDDQRVWSVVCFFIARSFRRRGVMVELLRAAVEYAESRGAHIVEGYPIEPKTSRLPDVFAWSGVPAAFHKVGFAEVLRRSPTRPMMRLVVGRK